MNKGNRTSLMLLVLFLLLSLACNFGLELPWDIGVQDVEISPEDVSEAATRAAVAAATAVAQGDTVVETVVAQSGDLAATAQIIPTPPPGEAVLAGTALQQKLANIQPDGDGNFTVAVTEGDLNEFITGQEGGAFQTDTLSAENIQVQITPEHIELTGDVTQPIALPLNVKMRPSVASGQLQFDLLSASTGILPVPESMLDLIETGVNSELGRALTGLPDGVSIQEVMLADGVLTILGHQN